MFYAELTVTKHNRKFLNIKFTHWFDIFEKIYEALRNHIATNIEVNENYTFSKMLQLPCMDFILFLALKFFFYSN